MTFRCTPIALPASSHLILKAKRRERDADAGHGKAIVHGLPWKGGVSLDSTEALFLGRGNDLAVAEQARGAVVVEG